MAAALLKVEFWLVTLCFVIDGSDAVRDAKQSDDMLSLVEVSEVGVFQFDQSQGSANHSNRVSRGQADANLSVHGDANQSQRASIEGRAGANFSLHDSLNSSGAFTVKKFRSRATVLQSLPCESSGPKTLNETSETSKMFEKGAPMSESGASIGDGADLVALWGAPDSSSSSTATSSSSSNVSWTVDSIELVSAEWLPMIEFKGHLVGKGSFGSVYIVETTCSPGSNVQLAFKKANTKGALDMQEAAYGIILNHPYLIKTYEFDPTKGVIMMEAAKGGQVEELATDMDDRSLTKVILEMLVAVQYLHEQGYVHADLKPEQFFFDKRCAKTPCKHRIAKLGDFGLMCEPPSCKGFAGSPMFMDPDGLHKMKSDFHNDIWSMGVIIHLFTKRGYDGEMMDPWFIEGISSAQKIMEQLKSLYKNYTRTTNRVKGMRPIHGGTSTLDQLIAGCLTLPAEKRFTATEALEKAKQYAREQGFSEEEIQDITQPLKWPLDRWREQLPTAWPHCKDKNCGRRDQIVQRCMQVPDQTDEVQCVDPNHFASKFQRGSFWKSEGQSRSYMILAQSRPQGVSIELHLFTDGEENGVSEWTPISHPPCFKTTVLYSRSRSNGAERSEKFYLFVNICMEKTADSQRMTVFEEMANPAVLTSSRGIVLNPTIFHVV